MRRAGRKDVQQAAIVAALRQIAPHEQQLQKRKGEWLVDTTVSSARIARTETRFLAVKLTDDELRDRGDKLAAVIQDLNAEENRQVDIKTGMKARLAELDSKKTQLAIVISRREENRDVMVDIVHDYDRLVVDVVRRDTGEIVSSRAMTEDERQPPLPIPA